MSNNDDKITLLKSISKFIKNIIKQEIIVTPTVNDTISNNAKSVIFALFSLIIFSIILYAFLITGKYNPDSDFIEIPINEFRALEKDLYKDLLNDRNMSNVDKIQQIQEFNEQRITNFQDRFQQIEQIDAVFMSAITGIIALGGTLITQISDPHGLDRYEDGIGCES